ncbi:hypothetical protein FCR2A7T_24780 [Flavobacterium cauense R2A-7]|uniref:Uncharacterized protein n=1 Tax=Flavobacterium cauense R2A-7 TaxID=1341154 RepID=V6RX52_9FLAO|nr:hypothetical protein [Flavobacterium cauense]ESU19061.1 hypothetical protein FCR2A7T_24780 [Flavobacterium cauense R2A-7]TWI15273.1 hypothetical protein IP98_00265 [Flavobacterium cauense R2A-7]
MDKRKKENKTELSDDLKSGIENLSGLSTDDVKTHFNSDKPAQLKSQTYAQGSAIHLEDGKEKHMPHETWRVVQQKQGRVQPTKQLNDKTIITDNQKLEEEADKIALKNISKETTDSINP